MSTPLPLLLRRRGRPRKLGCCSLALALAFVIWCSPSSFFSATPSPSSAVHPASPHSSPELAPSTVALLRHVMFPRSAKFLSDPAHQQPISGAAPTGLASYGSLGTTLATAVRGSISITSLGIGFFSATFENNSQLQNFSGTGAASLQNNAFLWIGGSAANVYWTQDVVAVNQTSATQFALQLIDNVWNFSTTTNNIEPSGISGSGSVQCVQINNQRTCPYIAVGSTFQVTAPFSVNLTMVARTGAGAVTVDFDYAIRGSSAGQAYSGTYDSATFLPGRPAQTSYFQIGGDTPLELALPGGTVIPFPSDLEYVFGGPGGGSSVFINSISASEQLLFQRNSSSPFSPVPDAYSIGSVTGETAFGISVARNFANVQAPGATLRSGYVSAYELWPSAPALSAVAAIDYTSGSVSIVGRLDYSVDSSAASASSLANASIHELVNGSVVASGATDPSGRFGFVFSPKAEGTYDVSVEYPGSPALLAERVGESFAVSSVSLSGTSGFDAPPLEVNSAPFAVGNASRLLIPVENGTQAALSFGNSTDSPTVRAIFQGFTAATGAATTARSLTLNGSSWPETVTATFVTQYLVTISNPYTSSSNSTAWTSSSQGVKLSAPQTVTTSSGQVLSFKDWLVNGKVASTDSTYVLHPDSPAAVVAEYTPSPAISFLLIVGAAVAASLVVGFLVGYLMLRRRGASPAPLV